MLRNLIQVKLVVYCRHPCTVSKHLVDTCHQQFWVSGQSLTFSTYFAYPGLKISDLSSKTNSPIESSLCVCEKLNICMRSS